MVFFDVRDPDASVRLSKQFVEGSAWRLSKVVTDSTETKWIGAPKKIVVDLKKSKTEQVTASEECSRTATVIHANHRLCFIAL